MAIILLEDGFRCGMQNPVCECGLVCTNTHRFTFCTIPSCIFMDDIFFSNLEVVTHSNKLSYHNNYNNYNN